MIRVAVVGFGYWGPNLVRNAIANDDLELVVVADIDKDKLSRCNRLYPSVPTSIDIEEVITEKSIDAIIIATPVHTHFNLCKLSLEAGKHVLVEKPFASSSIECLELVTLAEAKNLTIMVDHTFLYSPAVQVIKEKIQSGEIGKLTYFDSTRINLGLFQNDVNVIWDLAPHDLSILFAITQKIPCRVLANGKSHEGEQENIAYMTLQYDDDFIAHFHFSWISPVKVRRTFIGGNQKMIVYDDVEPTEKVKIYDSNYKVLESKEQQKEKLYEYRIGDIHVPKIRNSEPLAAVMRDFSHSIRNRSEPVSNSKIGLNVIKVIEAAQVSIELGGAAVEVDLL
ncbi:Gfo/Idh/MocA family protein [Pseudobacteriovorax antillogorgiicola]|uniref:Predicted dehydrogenase n=1 Tax=Pseudobacteriovorax antillogorgiicola TaxID=1513793 RepID=A0A1Y6CTC2_9BACT|nr:Gfo/Idh/MocA family oxidoreductase [Pseudobacteriovorax antillogorgiicola]TCS45198.1 putative dehydrogenase [Pseudobacteriovorax antillogorgiicola]SMF75549.1 Predicted dehydrogenase [Pseudobacteriovorax antillogorgiicola]